MKFITNLFVALAILVFPAWALAGNASDTKAALVSYILDGKGSKASPSTARQIVDAAFKAGDKYGVDPFYILSVIKAESNFNPKAYNRSGASGLMQVIPRWHREKLKGQSPFNINVAVEAGTQVINEYLDAHKGNLKKAMRKYSGGASDRYYKRIQATHQEMRTAVVVHRFQKELPLPVVTSVYGDVRTWHDQIKTSQLTAPAEPAPSPTVADGSLAMPERSVKASKALDGLIAFYDAANASQ